MNNRQLTVNSPTI